MRSWRTRVVIALGLAVLFGALTFVGMSNGVFQAFTLQLGDNLQPTGQADDDVVVIAIDSDALLAKEGGQWPWSRAKHAKIVDRLREAGVRAIGYDVAFSESGEGDDALAAALHRTSRTVMAGAGELSLQAPTANLMTLVKPALPVPVIGRETSAIGHVNVTPDGDGVVRSLPLMVDDEEGELIPALSFALVSQARGLTGPVTVRGDGVLLDGEFFPTGPRTFLDISYTPELRVEAEDAPIISAADVLEDAPGLDERLEGKIVLVGVTDPTLGDDRPTPVAKDVEMPGVLIHASAVNTMLSGQYLTTAGPGRVALAAGAVAAISSLGMLLLPVSIAPLAALAALAGYVVWAFSQVNSGTVLNLLYPPFAILLAFVSSLGYRYFTEMRGRRRVSALFSEYVPTSVANELMASGRVDDAIRGERLVVSVFFCDLRGFTAISSKLSPTQVRDLLNVYYDESSKLVHEYGGTLLNYIGDEVFAVWGAPLPDENSADNAVACSRAIQDAKERVDARLASDGLPPITYGIGVHTGEVIAAHVGTELHRQYTILGDTVNCASRLCTIAGQNEICVSSETYEAMSDRPPSDELPGVKLKGVGRDLFPHKLWPDELKDTSGKVRGKLEE